MAKVILLNNWFAPNGQLFRKSASKLGPPVDIPDDVADRLPKTAKLVSDDYVTPVVRPGKDTFSEHQKMLDQVDEAKAAVLAEIEVREKAEQALRLRQELVEQRPKRGRPRKSKEKFDA